MKQLVRLQILPWEERCCMAKRGGRKRNLPLSVQQQPQRLELSTLYG